MEPTTRRLLLVSGVYAMAASLAGCALPVDPPVFDPRALSQSERQIATQDEPEPIAPLATTQEDPTGGPGDEAAGTTRPLGTPATTTGPTFGSDGEPILQMSLQQAIQRAVVYNRQVKVAGYQPAIDATSVTEAQAHFDPVFFTTVQFAHKDDETAGTLFFNPATNESSTIAFFDRQQIYTGQLGIRQNLASGGQVEFRFDSSYNDLVPQRFVENPYYQNDFTLQLTQPLLKNFGADVNNARIVINRGNARISLLEFRKTLEDQISKVEETYWQLVDKIEAVKVDEELLKANDATYDLQYKRFQQHLNSVLEVSQAQSFLESRRAQLARDRADARNLSDQLKQLMNDPNIPVASPLLIIPLDQPVEQEMVFNIDEQINAGMENRYELGEQLEKIDQATVTYFVAKNNTLPELDFVGSVSPNATKGDYRDTLSDQTKFGNWDYSLGLQFQFPIGNREALSIFRRTALQREQAIDQYSEIVSQVSLDIRQACREVSVDFDLIDSNRQARLAAERELQQVVDRQDKGVDPLDPTFVQLRLQVEGQLAAARQQENDAISQYNIALERLERAKGTLLRYNNVVLQEDPYKNQGLLR